MLPSNQGNAQVFIPLFFSPFKTGLLVRGFLANLCMVEQILTTGQTRKQQTKQSNNNNPRFDARVWLESFGLMSIFPAGLWRPGRGQSRASNDIF